MTDYDEYALLYTTGTKGLGQDFHMATLYSTHPPPGTQSGLRWGAPGGLPKLRRWGQQRPPSTEACGFSFLPQAAPRPRGPR